jgi:hypothetical protein
MTGRLSEDPLDSKSATAESERNVPCASYSALRSRHRPSDASTIEHLIAALVAVICRQVAGISEPTA